MSLLNHPNLVSCYCSFVTGPVRPRVRREARCSCTRALSLVPASDGRPAGRNCAANRTFTSSCPISPAGRSSTL
jgi:hypothetical protein